MDIYKRLKDLGIVLPEPSAPVGLFKHVNQAGNLLYVSGQGSYYQDHYIKGKAGTDIPISEAQLGARYCVLNTLAALQAYLGDLNKVKQVVKILGFVAGDEDFSQQPLVMNGASQIYIDIFGESGKHARSAIGTNSLPQGLTVEVESILEIY
jgi:enamine deaminase RidA (YjgF/YER057c/UK114 family)